LTRILARWLPAEARNLQSHAEGDWVGSIMVNSDHAAAGRSAADHTYADLEAQLLRAVSDFGLQELSQMLDVAEVIRRTRRL